MRRISFFWLAIGGGLLYLALANRQKLFSVAQDAGDSIMASVSGWKNVNQGPTWAPIIDAIGATYHFPPDLLSRMAYQESHFREDIIRGATASSEGALGIMQLMPQYFQSVNVARPYNDTDVRAQILEAASNLAALYRQFKSWPLAIAGYNAGAGNVTKYGGIPPFAETQAYVADVLKDVPNLV